MGLFTGLYSMRIHTGCKWISKKGGTTGLWTLYAKIYICVICDFQSSK